MKPSGEGRVPLPDTSAALVGVAPAGSLHVGTPKRLLLHAGPPFASPEDIPQPVLRSLEAACLIEEWAASWEEARELLLAGDVSVAPAQDHGLAVPLAGVISPSMTVAVVREQTSGAQRGAALNEGVSHALRLGVRDPEIVAHHQWLDNRLASWLASALVEPLALWPLLDRSLQCGDDGHSRTEHGSQLISAALMGRTPAPGDVAEFLAASPGFALNVWMAAAAAALAAAALGDDATLVVASGGNGKHFGIRLARSDEWITAPAVPPRAR